MKSPYLLSSSVHYYSIWHLTRIEKSAGERGEGRGERGEGRGERGEGRGEGRGERDILIRLWAIKPHCLLGRRGFLWYLTAKTIYHQNSNCDIFQHQRNDIR